MSEFASADLTVGQLNAIVKKLGGHDKAMMFLQGKLTVSEPTRNWREQDGVIYLSVTSDGTTGPEWIKRFKSFLLRGFLFENLLCSTDFKPTKGVTTEIAILKDIPFRTTENIRALAVARKLTTPNAEVVCLIREKFSDEEIEAIGMKWIVIMHEPINGLGGTNHYLLCLNGVYLHACQDSSNSVWCRDHGFAFVVSQTGPQN